MNERETPQQSTPAADPGPGEGGTRLGGETGRSGRPADFHDVEVPGPDEAWMGAGPVEPEETVVRTAASGGILTAEEPEGRRKGRREASPEGGEPEGNRERQHGARPGRGDRSPAGRSGAPPAEGRRSFGGRSAGDRPGPRRSPGGSSALYRSGAPAAPPHPGRPAPRREQDDRSTISDEEIEASLPRETDPMKRALALLGRIGADVEEGEGEATETGAGPSVEPPAGDGTPPEQEPGPERGETREARRPGGDGTVPEARRRPGVRTLFTLQDVHERTGIPYATLALYAATLADRIPSAGERHSPAYPRQGLETFCQIHAEKNPGWQPPEGALSRGWDDEDGLAARLEALEDVQRRLVDELRETLRQVSRTWHGEAEWV